MKKVFAILSALAMALSLTGCGEVKTAESNTESNTGGTGTAAAEAVSTALQQDTATSDYETELKVFVVGDKYMEAQWTFAEGATFDTSVLAAEQLADEYNPLVTLTFSGGREKDDTDALTLNYEYNDNAGNGSLTPNLAQLFDTARFVANSAESAECNFSEEIQGNTLILGIKAPEGSSFDFTSFKWFATKIRFGYDEASAVYKEYGAEVISDYSMNQYPNPEYTTAEPENAPQEVSFEGQSFTADSEYYTIFKFDVPKVYVFEDDWYYSEAWDTWLFTSLSEKYSSITEYQITSYDSAGNVLSRETRTAFPSQEDLLSCYRGDKGSSESEKDLTFETVESRLSFLYDYYSASCPNIRAEENVLYNGDYFGGNVIFSDTYDLDLSRFKPDSSGCVNESVSYKFMVEGGFSDADYTMQVTAYYSDASLYPNN